MKNISIIQVVLIGISIVAIMTAVVMFSMFKGGGSRVADTEVIMWGTIPEETFGAVLTSLENQDNEIKGLKYVEKNQETFDDELLKAIAEGEGPDLVLLNEKQIIANQKRMQVISFDTFPLRDYQDLFIEESSLLVSQEGLLGIPFLVDPLVMYYNKDTLTNAGFSKPPQTWTEVLAVTPNLTQKDSSFNISKSAIALGSFDNIVNAKDIYWTLVLQAGNPVVKRDIEAQDEIETYTSIFVESLNFTLNPAYAATNFFTQFSNPTKTVYSWNRSLSNSQTMFTSGDLAFYLGRASELSTIKQINPNLNFDVTLVPQSQSSTRKATYGSMYVLTIPRSALNPEAAMNVINLLTSKDIQSEFARTLEISSVREDLLVMSDSTNPYESIFNRSAIMSQGILEPDTRKTDDIIKEIIDTVVSGQYEVSSAISRADQKLSLLLRNE
jgi:ABC-type glycerol-3-phosphate transport system substrate-binding protein